MKNKPALYSLIIFFSLGTFCISACGQLPDYRDFGNTDMKPPELDKIYMDGTDRIVLIFDEPLSEIGDLFLEPDGEIKEADENEEKVTITTSVPALPGRKYTLGGTVRDIRGNSLTFLYSIFGYNPNPPEAVINEFITQGSSSHPDLVELKIIKGGNTGGLFICEGTTDYFDDSLVMPSLEVEKDDYIIIHFKPRGIPEEVNETMNKDSSGGLDSSPGAWDFWIKGGNGLSGNNGVIGLYSYPGGPIMDGILYSNRTSESDANYRGFGSTLMMNKADQLIEEKGWKKEGDSVSPEDGINPDDSTSTRSICRNPNGINSRSAEDWHITPTGGSSFGGQNTREIYTP